MLTVLARVEILAHDNFARARARLEESLALLRSLDDGWGKMELSGREVEVLRLVAAGLSDAAVAEQLHLSPRTVNSHLRTIYEKLGVSSRTAAARFASDHQLL